jgi:hypothetical protein
MRDYIKNLKYNTWHNKNLEDSRKSVLIIKCPYCKKDTAVTGVTEIVDLDKLFITECEECRTSFYFKLSAEIKTIKYSAV